MIPEFGFSYLTGAVSRCRAGDDARGSADATVTTTSIVGPATAITRFEMTVVSHSERLFVAVVPFFESACRPPVLGPFGCGRCP